ncbi:hypothetical protein [Dyadobacter sp. CY356]|uniref:hypothetical protein n=1 Tax=Dyadobacter sp. CY356 TaxID=2906442 RepID=UPI001F3A23C9|nr:hypothetical protein [Dyadobacter sp. CY356]MCF0058934.1 hypothetical protein [Dyadobacter sp. CY356]
MVRVGFICEGKTERKIIESENFQQYLTNLGIECLKPVLDAKGSGNLLPENLRESLELYKARKAEKIVILTDLDEDACITVTKNRITSDTNRVVIVAVRKIESWFLADSLTLSLLLKEQFSFDKPEEEASPFVTLKNIFIQQQGRGIGVKDIFTARMIKYGFSVQNAASHPNCPSATYFLSKLEQIAKNNFRH